MATHDGRGTAVGVVGVSRATYGLSLFPKARDLDAL
jgi:hypothetical protein